MIYNELLQWALLAFVIWRVFRHEVSLNMIAEAFIAINRLLQSIKDAVEDDSDDDKQD
jgi:hypothetical protein